MHAQCECSPLPDLSKLQLAERLAVMLAFLGLAPKTLLLAPHVRRFLRMLPYVSHRGTAHVATAPTRSSETTLTYGSCLLIPVDEVPSLVH